MKIVLPKMDGAFELKRPRFLKDTSRYILEQMEKQFKTSSKAKSTPVKENISDYKLKGIIDSESGKFIIVKVKES